LLKYLKLSADGFMKKLEQLEKYRQDIETELDNLEGVDRVPLFYEPMAYINQLPGKKLRPLLTIISGLALNGKLEYLLKPASAIELLHNFSLVHDDIMDNDDVRRGQPTVHVKWDLGTAILAGDGLLGLAYRKLLQTPNIQDTRLAAGFTEAMIEICEGQALDKMFETQILVSVDDYLEMISKKTAVLIRLSTEFGGIVGEGSTEQVKTLSDLGFNIGMGFQIQDDLLDIMADEAVLGKKVGSDLQMNKKTIVSIKLHEKSRKFPGAIENVEEYRNLLHEHNIIPEVEEMMESYFNTAESLFQKLPENSYTHLLHFLISYIRNREK
jgi:geranylgeranyl pyrophosphate synthase